MNSTPAPLDYPWYDSWWLRKYTRARAILARVRPDKLRDFDAAFAPLQTDPRFTPRLFDRPLETSTLQEIEATVRKLKPADLELHEARNFGRFVVHDHPLFTRVQQALLPLVSDAAGEEVEAGYNFLSLYTAKGICRVHLDAPAAKWTLDLCIAQTTPWPIYFSQVVPWPHEALTDWSGADWERAIKTSPALSFAPVTLTPGQAVLFSGSSQWHYREPFPAAQGHCHLLFFHYHPRGTAALLDSSRWAERFGVPELHDPAPATP